jgi:hypothetical protein
MGMFFRKKVARMINPQNRHVRSSGSYHYRSTLSGDHMIVPPLPIKNTPHIHALILTLYMRHGTFFLLPLQHLLAYKRTISHFQ